MPFPSGPLLQLVANDLVGKVIEFMHVNISGQDVHCTTFNIVGYTIEEMKDVGSCSYEKITEHLNSVQ